MGIWSSFTLAVGLAMDAFAVSVSDGMCYRNLKRRQALLIAALFGIFQGIMPCIGFVAGSAFSDAVRSIDHWVALILLGFIGGKMIWEAASELRHPEKANLESKKFSLRTVLLQAVATSIDALAVGVSYAFMDVNIIVPALIITAVTFVFCVVGVFAGGRLGIMFRQKAEIFGGAILVVLGAKIFIEHMWF